MSEEQGPSMLTEASAIIIAGMIISAGILIIVTVLFVGTSWALRQFGYNVSFEQFMAAMFLLIIVRIALSYLLHQNK